MIAHLIAPPLCLLEKTYRRSAAWRVGLWIGGLAMVGLLLQFSSYVWIVYALLAPPVLLRAALASKNWAGRTVFLLLGAAMAMFGLGRGLWHFWPKLLEYYVGFLDLGHMALLAHALVMLLSSTERGREVLGIAPSFEREEQADADHDPACG